jgi:hypothetical protein
MPTPGFPAHTLNDEGDPIWIAELADEAEHHLLHVVRGLEPADALAALGADPQLFRPCELPGDRTGKDVSLPAAALGVARGGSAVLMAGRIGEWTFVYDDCAATYDEGVTAALSADGRTAASSMMSINADASLTYAVDGVEIAWVNVDDLDLDADLPGMPAELRAAFEAAGVVELEYEDDADDEDEDEDDGPDYAITMRAACALAGLACTLDELRRIPLLATTFG